MDNRQIKILAIDDNNDNLISIRALIREAFPSALVFTALTGKEGLKLASAQDPDVILLDIIMPEMSGFEVCKTLKSDKSMVDIPIVFVTSTTGDKEGRIRALECGAEAFLTKPIEETELIAQVNSMVKIKAANTEKKQEKERLTALVDLQTHELKLTHTATLNLLEDINSENEARKKSEQALKESEALFSGIFYSSPIPVSLSEFSSEKWIAVNEAFLKVTEFSRDEIIGHTFSEINLWKNLKDREVLRRNLLKEGHVSNFEVKINKKYSGLGVILISVEKVELAGQPYLLIIGTEITERIKAQAKQFHADRMTKLGEMASGIAHEINQPLNIISLVMDKILLISEGKETIDSSFFKENSFKIFDNIDRIKNIIDHIRAFSSNHDDYILTAFDINFSIENAVSLIIDQFKQLSINLNLDLEKPIPKIVGNTYKFEQVIVNLLSNARDAVVERKRKNVETFDMTVGIKSFVENELLIVEVTDNGIGIRNEDINNVILPFYTTKDTGKGTGLGLSICYQIIHEINGRMEITSDQMNETKIKILFEIKHSK